MQVHDDLGSGITSCCQRAPAQAGMQVMGVDDASAGTAHRSRHLLGAQPAAQEPGRGSGTPQMRRIALEQLGVLAQVLSDEPQQVIL
jgi:hypothetical protein